MSLSQQDLNTLAQLHTLRAAEKDAIDKALRAAVQEIEAANFVTLGDSHLAALQAALTRYFLASNPDILP